MKNADKVRADSGFTLLELIVTISISTVIMGGTVLGLREMANSSRHGSYAISSYIEMARAQAISSTSTVIVKATDVQTIQGYSATSCSDGSPVIDSDLSLSLPNDYSLTSIGWEICFTPRGFASSSQTIPVIDLYDVEHSVEVFIGGGVRVS